MSQTMRVLIAGIDGYLGWPLALHLATRGHEVYGIDNFSRRRNVAEVGSWSAIPIPNMRTRLEVARNLLGLRIKFFHGDLRKYQDALSVMRESKPDAIVHLGEQPSAPYSMIDSKHASFTQENNVTGTLNLLWAMKESSPNAHLVKLGTMGEYGTPNIEIPEGFFEIEYRGRKDRLPFPRQPGSFYHLSKVHDSANIALACKIWGLMSTDIMQGVVYGTNELAELVRKAADSLGISVEILSVENPRIEMEEHFYKVEHENLKKLGFRPTRAIEEELEIMLTDLAKFKSRVRARKDAITPRVRWKGGIALPIKARVYDGRSALQAQTIRLSSG